MRLQGKIKTSRTILITVFFSAFMLTLAGAQEKRVRKSDLPPAVQKAADEQSKGATVRGYATEMDEGQRVYEVQLTVDRHSKDVTMDPQGNFLEVEEQVALSSLPAQVREGLQKQAGPGKLGKVESLTRKGTLVAYEAQVLKSTKHTEIRVGPDGTTVDHKQ